MAKTVNARLREARTSFDAPLRVDPRWLIIRRVRFADRVRSALYGVERARPYGRKARMNWCRLLRWYTASRALRHIEVLAIAATLADEMRARGWKVERP